MAISAKKPSGKLIVRVDYHTHYHFYMTVAIRELRLSAPINLEGKTFEVPAGTYTVVLEGLMGDPDYQGAYSSGFRAAYGRFDRRERVEVRTGEETVCTFAFPKELAAVRVCVVLDGSPVVGADVLIREADPNFRATRGADGALFYLEPGTYPVVVAYRDLLMKEILRVDGRDETVTLDLSRQVALRPALVVVRYGNGRTLKGTTEDLTPGASRFTLTESDGGRVVVEGFAGVKAVFFVKSLLGDSGYDEQKDFAIARQFGRKTVVTFEDNEEFRGYTLPGQTGQPQFFLFPVDPQSNNAKIYVVREATTEIRFA